MDEHTHARTDPALDDATRPGGPDDDEGEYYGEVYGSGAGFEWFWWGATWLTVPLFVAYLIYRIVT